MPPCYNPCHSKRFAPDRALTYEEASLTTPYRDVSQLVVHCRKDRDFQIRIVDPGSEVTIAAVHGGRIEPLTSALAEAIAGDEYNLYDFAGIRVSNNAQLRVPVARFAEMRLNALMRRSQAALHVDGVPGERAVVHLGGQNRTLKDILAESLAEAGLVVEGPHSPGAAHDPRRFYNTPAAGGVQMELSLALRQQMVGGPLEPEVWEDSQRRTALFTTVTQAVRDALERYLAETRSDLDAAMERFERSTERFPSSLRQQGHSDHDHHHGNGDDEQNGSGS
jgi:phage replication-related protein YjqB (UPF0714/DUF867 family)